MRFIAVASILGVGFVGGLMAAPSKPEDRIMERVTGVGGVFFTAKDDWMLAQLRANGVTVEPKIAEEFNGRFAWVVDPEGNKIELWEPKEGH